MTGQAPRVLPPHGLALLVALVAGVLLATYQTGAQTAPGVVLTQGSKSIVRPEWKNYYTRVGVRPQVADDIGAAAGLKV